MASLRQSLKKPRTWLLLVAGLALLALADSFRSPSRQVTGWLYVRAVRLYQYAGRPLLQERVQCRYHPTCSEYSIEAVETHGIRGGLVLTVRRVRSCTADVSPCTHDPVPPPDAEE